MKIGEALAEIKSKKSELSRYFDIMQSKIFRIEGETSDIDIKTIPDKIQTITDDIRKMKIRVLKTNLNTKYDKNLNLQEAILKVGDIRSMLSHYQPLFEREKYFFSKSEEKPRIPQLSEKENEDRIKNLQKEKVIIDNRIQLLNWQIDLLE